MAEPSTTYWAITDDDNRIEALYRYSGDNVIDAESYYWAEKRWVNEAGNAAHRIMTGEVDVLVTPEQAQAAIDAGPRKVSV